MRISRLSAGLATVALVTLLGTASAQEGAPPIPQPGPEHALLKDDAGVWDASLEMYPGPGAPPMTSTGVETNTLGCGGLCLITDFKSDMMGQPFHGHGVAAYDMTKKKYTSTWMDSMSMGLGLAESTYDAAKKTLTGYMEGPDMTGQIVKTKMVTEWKDADTRVFTLSAPGPDGKDVVGLRITYKRRK